MNAHQILEPGLAHQQQRGNPRLQIIGSRTVCLANTPGTRGLVLIDKSDLHKD